MASPRLVLLLICLLILPTFLTFFSLLHAHPRRDLNAQPSSMISKSGFRAFFSFHPPATLFPASAIISMTDDNSTFFLARPADFGPKLPSKGLSGQLWVGSGFGDDNLGRGGATTGAEGELGCSDVPGWEEGRRHNHGDTESVVDQAAHEGTKTNKKSGKPESLESLSSLGQKEYPTPEKDGTDDHLHLSLLGSQGFKPSGSGETPQDEYNKVDDPTTHADIQSLQESAEIAGKVVLLSRGGCGFLEKTKWVQRRGGIALIVGDDTRGGLLVTMYARGDTSNITIPSLFTSHTTAHLLSSLIPLGGLNDGLLQGDTWNTNPDQAQSGSDITAEKGKSKDDLNGDRPTFTRTSSLTKPTTLTRSSTHASRGKPVKFSNMKSESGQDQHKSWLGVLISKVGIGRSSQKSSLSADSRRPPSSGRLNWVNEKWADETSKGMKTYSKPGAGAKDQSPDKGFSKSTSQQTNGDDFVIGVQDWRDPDLVPLKSFQVKDRSKVEGTGAKLKSSSPQAMSNTGRGTKDRANPLTGGIITPGSGEYEKPTVSTSSEEFASEQQQQDSGLEDSNQQRDSMAWPRPPVYGQDLDDVDLDSVDGAPEYKKAEAHEVGSSNYRANGRDHTEEHAGLWVTLTPTTMSTSPFFDTLLVLVVSPLVTLTVVYALLLLRSRIRRRRWRAPKSVVDRLPVRIYHTMSCSSTSSSSRFASPKASSPATPLLQSSHQPNLSCPRPRSRTTSDVSESQSVSVAQAARKASLARNDKNPRAVVSKKKYTGKQVECVVCLEEYVDGHSRVMSLPCGHEFHVDCM